MFKNSWDNILKDELKKAYFKDLCNFLSCEYDNYRIFPPKQYVFEAFLLTPFEDVKVVILGQDPYPTYGHACGLAFGVPYGITIPKSLRNIYLELEKDKKIKTPNHGNLISWAEHGVFLLNSVLTVREGNPGSHRGKGWEIFTDAVISKLNEKSDPIVFILWGNYAKEKAKLITNKNHLVITGTHPSPLSAHRGFFGGKYFTRAEKFIDQEVFVF